MTFGAMTPGFYVHERIAGLATQFLPEDISPAQNKLYISLTRNRVSLSIAKHYILILFQDKMNRIVSTYPNKEYLIKCLLASCYIPIYSLGYYGVAPEIDGEVIFVLILGQPNLFFQQYIDGGYTENLPNFKVCLVTYICLD